MAEIAREEPAPVRLEEAEVVGAVAGGVDRLQAMVPGLETKPLEAVEKIEAIRFLEYGRKIKMAQTRVTGIEIDTPEDLEKAKKVWT